MISHLKQRKEPAHKTVFVLDDWPDIIKLFEHTSRASQFDMMSATTNAEALSNLNRVTNKNDLHIAFIDVEIGTDSGLDIYEAIRREIPKLPVVIMTGRPDNKNLVRLISNDPYASFLSKPFFMEEIQGLIADPCGRAGDVRELVELSMFIEETKLL